MQLSLATGQRTALRAPAMNGAVNDLALSGGRLFLGGAFTTLGAVAHGGVGTVNATTGALDNYMGVDVTVNHNWEDGAVDVARTPVGVDRFDITPDGTRLVITGNFTFADGLTRDQIAIVLLQPGGAVVDPNWRTQRYEPACYAWAFDHYTRDINISPDGTYFAVVTSGGGNPGTLCDTVARWDFADSGDDVQPRWADYSGGDSLFSVEVTGSAVYVGGHQRWMNNPFGQDSPGAGATPRPGPVRARPAHRCAAGLEPGPQPARRRRRGDAQHRHRPVRRHGHRLLRQPAVPASRAWATSRSPAAPPCRRRRPARCRPGVNIGGALPNGGGGAATGPVLYRVNAGGPELASLDAGPAWSDDDGSFHTEGRTAPGGTRARRPTRSVPADHSAGGLRHRAVVAERRPGDGVGLPGDGR